MDDTTIRDHLDEIRDYLNGIEEKVGDLTYDVEPERYVSELSGNFSYPIGETGAELLNGLAGGPAYLDVSTVSGGEMYLDDDTITDLIEALRALQASRAAQAA